MNLLQPRGAVAMGRLLNHILHGNRSGQHISIFLIGVIDLPHIDAPSMPRHQGNKKPRSKTACEGSHRTSSRQTLSPSPDPPRGKPQACVHQHNCHARKLHFMRNHEGIIPRHRGRGLESHHIPKHDGPSPELHHKRLCHGYDKQCRGNNRNSNPAGPADSKSGKIKHIHPCDVPHRHITRNRGQITCHIFKQDIRYTGYQYKAHGSKHIPYGFYILLQLFLCHQSRPSAAFARFSGHVPLAAFLSD